MPLWQDEQIAALGELFVKAGDDPIGKAACVAMVFVQMLVIAFVLRCVGEEIRFRVRDVRKRRIRHHLQGF